MTLELLEEPGQQFKKPLFMIGWCAATFFTVILRNNAVYVMILFIPLFIWKLRAYWKKTLISLCAVSLIYLLYVGVFCPAFTIDGISSREFISVPTQQLMRVYTEKYDALSPEEITTYEVLFDEVARMYYNPKISDIVKFRFNMEEFNSNPQYYISFYIKQGMKYPDVYLNSFLHNTYGFWYPFANLALDLDGNEGYFVCHSLPPAVDNSLIPSIYEYYLLYEDSYLVYGNSVLKALFLPGTYWLFFMFTFTYALYTKQTDKILILSFVLLIWLTFLLGPVALVRYVAFLYYIIPLEISFLSKKTKTS